MPHRKTRPTYSADTKQRALQLLDDGVRLNTVARITGVHSRTISGWLAEREREQRPPLPVDLFLARRVAA